MYICTYCNYYGLGILFGNNYFTIIIIIIILMGDSEKENINEKLSLGCCCLVFDFRYMLFNERNCFHEI